MMNNNMQKMKKKFHFVLLLLSASFMRRSSCCLLRGFPDENTLSETSGVSPRIIDGYNVEEEDRYPYFGMIVRGSMCGSVLIGPDLVLSAAHCADISDSVTIGVHDRSNRGETQTIGIEEQIIHPQYTRTSFRYDMMILKLEEKADTNQYAKINRNGQIPSVYEALSTTGNNNGGELTVIGFGDTTKESGDDLASILQETQVQYVEQEQCENVHGRWMIREDMLCAYGDGTDACYGDSGGPLIMKGEDSSDDVVVGIVSWGRGCATGVFPGVYARVSYFYDWIVQVACDVSDDHPFDCTDAPSETPSVTPSEMPFESPSSIPTSIDNLDIRINPVATFVGWTVSPSNPLQRCQGDCDNDDECEGDLVCFDQNGLSVPGCDGERERAIADYCVRPEDRNNATTSGDEG